MKLELINKKINQIKADIEIVFIVDKNLKHRWIADRALLVKMNYQGDTDEIAYLPHRGRLYIGIASLASDDIRIGAAKTAQFLRAKKYRSAKIGLYGSEKIINIQALAEGLILGTYKFDKFKSKKEKIFLQRIIIAFDEYGAGKADISAAQNAIKNGEIIAEATNTTREIVNQIPAECHPLEFTQTAKKIAKANKLTLRVYGEKYLIKEGMGAFLAVSQASPFPPQLIHITYQPPSAKTKIVLVGKGLTFDSGGLSLKPSDAMLTMKSDKAGASAILGILEAASKLNLPVEVHGIIGATENVVGHHGYKPDDVLKAKNGKTIEVKNTDAEGRLVLADCLAYAQELSPDYLIDIATLTGACIVALGEYSIGVMGHDRDLVGRMISAGEKGGELLVHLKFNRYLPGLLKSEVADLSNTSSARFGGAITGALFLSEFIEKKYQDKWLHLDIAPSAFAGKPWGANPYGATGASVRTIIEFLRSL